MKPETFEKAVMGVNQKGFLDIEIDPSIDLFAAIDQLKKEKNALVLAHYYQEPDRMWRIILAIASGWHKEQKKQMQT